MFPETVTSDYVLTLPLQLPPCGACTNLVTSFEAGVERTKRGKLEGGDAAWEEKSGQKYATSEVTNQNTVEPAVTVPPQVRLAEISEQLCKDVGRGETQCHVNHGDWEEDIEDWWRLDPATRWVGWSLPHHTPELRALNTT